MTIKQCKSFSTTRQIFRKTTTPKKDTKLVWSRTYQPTKLNYSPWFDVVKNVSRCRIDDLLDILKVCIVADIVPSVVQCYLVHWLNILSIAWPMMRVQLVVVQRNTNVAAISHFLCLWFAMSW